MTRTGHHLETRRLELGLSRQALADAVGCRAGAINGLEESGDLSNWPFRLVIALRDALGLTWDDLETNREPPTMARSDVQRIGAELARHGRVREIDLRASGLTVQQLEHVRADLAAVGMTLAAHQNGAFHLAAAEGHAPLQSFLGDSTNPLETFDNAEHRLLADAIAGRLRLQSLTHPQTRLLGGLIKKGHLKKHKGTVVVAGPLRTALGLGLETQLSEGTVDTGRD